MSLMEEFKTKVSELDDANLKTTARIFDQDTSLSSACFSIILEELQNRGFDIEAVLA